MSDQQRSGDSLRRGEDFLLDVAAVLEEQGFEIAIEPGVAGVQVDILATRGRGRSRTRLAVECKAYSRLVGLRSAGPYFATVQFLRETGHVDSGMLVTTEGFTPRVRTLAERFSVRLSTLSELRNELPPESANLYLRRSQLAQAAQRPRDKKRVFVIMPFSSDMNDVFLLGIRWVADDLGIVVHRADDLEHDGEIIAAIQDSIRQYDGVLGDTTGANPNVCYEVGFAHALDRPTVLICKKGESLPFDLRGVNHLMYQNIIHLREQLPSRLRAVLNL